MYKEKTNIIHTRWSAINLKPVNHALTFIPNPQVSFSISKRHNPHQTMMDKNMKFQALPKKDSFRMSNKAIAISVNSNNSSANDLGNGMLRFLFMINQLTTIKAQNTVILHLKAI